MKLINISNVVGFLIAVLFIYMSCVFLSINDDCGTIEEQENYNIMAEWGLENLGITPCCSTVAYYCYTEYLISNNLTKDEFPVYILQR